MMWFTKGKQKRSVLMVSDGALRFVQAVEHANKTMQIVAHIEQRLPEGIIVGGVIEQYDLFVEQLRGFRNKLPTGSVHVIIPEEAVLVVPLAESAVRTNKEKDLHQLIRDVLEKKLSETLAPTEGFSVLSIIDDGMRLYVDVASTTLVQTFDAVCTKAGFSVQSIDTPHPDWSHHASYKEHTHIMVLFGENLTTLTVLNGGISVLKTIVPVGRKDLVRAVRESLGCSTHEAEIIMRRYGVGVTHKEQAVLQTLYTTLLPLEKELHALIEAWNSKPYKTQRERIPMRSLLLHGEAVRVPWFDDHLARTTRMPAEMLDIPHLVHSPQLVYTMSTDEISRFAPLLWKAHELIHSTEA